MAGDGTRWCPICRGAKRPSEDICLACGITQKVKKTSAK